MVTQNLLYIAIVISTVGLSAVHIMLLSFIPSRQIEQEALGMVLPIVNSNEKIVQSIPTAGSQALLRKAKLPSKQADENMKRESPPTNDREVVESAPTANVKFLREVFTTANEVLQKAKIPYFFAYGTALGLVREGDFMEWDYDVDIGVLYDDVKDIDPALLRDSFFAGGFVPNDEWSTPYSFDCNGKSFPTLYKFYKESIKIGVDIFVFYEHQGRYWSYADGGENENSENFGTGHAYPKGEMDIVSVRGKKYRVMPTSWFELEYGPNWRTPVQFGWENQYQREKLIDGSGCVLPDPSVK